MTKLLEVQNITKKFGGLTAVNGVSFHLDEGDVLGLIGPNGSGKTTIFNIIMGDLSPDYGKVFFKEDDITKLPPHQKVRKGITRTYQVPRPFKEMTIFEGVRVASLSPSIIGCLNKETIVHELEIKKLLEEIGLGERLSMYPDELTMGDLRRVELARALVTKPRVVLLDEIFAGLTVAEIEEIDKLLKRKIKEEGLDFIIISHDLKALAPLVSRVVVVSFGQLIAEGSFDQVINNEKVKEAYLG